MTSGRWALGVGRWALGARRWQSNNTHSTLYIINNGSVQNFQVFCLSHEARFEEILCLSIKGFLIKSKIGLEGVKKNEG